MEGREVLEEEDVLKEEDVLRGERRTSRRGVMRASCSGPRRLECVSAPELLCFTGGEMPAEGLSLGAEPVRGAAWRREAVPFVVSLTWQLQPLVSTERSRKQASRTKHLYGRREAATASSGALARIACCAYETGVWRHCIRSRSVS